MICAARLEDCVCSRDADDGHDVHACTSPSWITASGRCHGQWRDDGTIVQYPTGAWTEAEAQEHAALLRARRPIPPLEAFDRG